MTRALIVSLVVALAATDAAAQGRGRGAASTSANRTISVRLSVKTSDGASVDGARVVLSGDKSAEFETAGAGTVILTDLKDGTYHVRCERDGFFPLERDFQIQGGSPRAIDVVLEPKPPAPPAPPPPPPPPAKIVPPSGPPVSVSIVDFLEHNYIGGKEPLSESVLACTPLETVRLLQIRDPVTTHAHADVDEVMYVVAGEGEVRLATQAIALKPGMMVVVPRSAVHGVERRGKNPLMLLSTLAGAPCQESSTSR